MDRNRVVITGLGAVSVYGVSVPKFWEGLISGKSGIRRITQFDPADLPCQIAGEIPDFNPADFIERKEARRMPRCAQIAVASAKEAVRDAGLPEMMPDPERAGVVYGTAIGGLDKLDEGVSTLRLDGYSKVNPFIIPAGIPNFPAFAVALTFQCRGPNSTLTTACATGTQVIGDATELIRRGAADIVLTGGTEALIQDYSIAGFCAMRALPINYNDCPELASRPFDLKREGFIFSEGSGTVVLESLQHALARGARIYAEVVGHASSADAYHMAAPDPEGLGPQRAMRWAIQDAGIDPNEVDYINAHGSSTPLNDPMETKAIKSVFGEHAYELAVSSTKSMIGHAMGASGTLEAMACTLAIHTGMLPPTINYETPDPECDLDYVPNVAREANIGVTLSNSFGLGGQNACVVLKRYVE